MTTGQAPLIGMPGFFGKMAAYADFVCRRLPDPFLEPWEHWVQEGMAASQAQLADRWPDVYLNSPVWRFALSPRVCGDRAWAGILLTGTDKAGRHFPFTLAVELPRAPNVLAALASASAWYAEADHIARSSLDSATDLETFDATVMALGGPPLLDHGAQPATQQSNPSDDDRIACRLEGQPPPNGFDWAALPEQLATRALSRHSVWWTEGSLRVGPSVLVCTGLPPPDAFPALLDGNWERWGRDIQSVPHRPRGPGTDTAWKKGEVGLRWVSAAQTDTGNVRRVNEDCVLQRPDIPLWAVADGMGGHQGGDVASRRVKTLLGEIQPTAVFEDLLHQISEKLTAANAELRALAAERDPGSIMGSTVVVVVAMDQRGACIWAGDSRAYRFRNGQLERLTRDHSLVEDLVRDGLLTAERASDHPSKNVITRAIGASDDLELDSVQFDIRSGDVLLLCSDGLTNELSDDEIALALVGRDPQAICKRLIGLALAREASDNISAILVIAEGA